LKKNAVETKITKEIIKNLSEGQVDELVFDKASDKYSETYGKTFQNTEKDIILLQLFACSVLDMEVCNGGFDQFFLNNQNLTDSALEGLLKIEAIEHYNLLINAKKIHNEQKEEFHNLRNPNLDELDEKFYELNKIDVNRQKFIVKNIEVFYD
jgi:hypothetical protein